jgi:hypothetical protein
MQPGLGANLVHLTARIDLATPVKSVSGLSVSQLRSVGQFAQARN